MSALNVPLHVEERHGAPRRGEAVRLSVPLPRGALPREVSVELVDADGRALVHQQRVLATWSDGSAKWLLIDFVVDIAARAQKRFFLRSAAGARELDETPLRATSAGTSICVDEVNARFIIGTQGDQLLQATSGDEGNRAPMTLCLRLTDDRGTESIAVVRDAVLEEAGPIRCAVVSSGHINVGSAPAALQFKARFTFLLGSGAVLLELLVRNPRAARHSQNRWDLGDPGSCWFRDLSLALDLGEVPRQLQWCVEPGTPVRSADASRSLTIYQDSSGGDRWNSSNHVDADGNLTVTFRGFEVREGDGNVVAAGDRAQPMLVASADHYAVALAIEKAWQNFPKALRCRGATLDAGLFPGECASPFELQGGEQKRHTVWIRFGAADADRAPAAPLCSLAAWVDPDWCEASRALPYVACGRNVDERYRAYVESIVEGPSSFAARREEIDEYGWRNFGDLYADHEAIGWAGANPLVSHYNNQYDFIYASAVHHLRTGDERWRRLMIDAARHTIDIDIYHTVEDRPVYNGGLFWHTDHYRDAATCTHRSFSRAHGAGAGYGGGPSNEHIYTSGLLAYHYLTGDPEAALAVIELADWAMAMDDGEATLFCMLHSGPTGHASRTVDADYHKPGRGAGNAINALLDAYAVSADRKYMFKAEELIRRCIHPHDDIRALRLDEPEIRWSYLVFLQVLGKYIDVKAEAGEIDYCFYYARDSLLHYAAWMLENEVPYKDALHKVELPTETWPAQDIRKCHVLHLAAKCARGEMRARFAERARFFFDRCLGDLLAFETAYLTRPRVLVAVYGPAHVYFETHGYEDEASPFTAAHTYRFGAPSTFVPQRLGMSAAVRRKLQTTWRELCLILRSRFPAGRRVATKARRR